MSLTNTYTAVTVDELERPMDDREKAPTELLVAGEPVAVDEFVARVLDRAHQAAHARAMPDEARVILELAHRFADELEKTNVPFDRLRFIDAAIEEPA